MNHFYFPPYGCWFCRKSLGGKGNCGEGLVSVLALVVSFGEFLVSCDVLELGWRRLSNSYIAIWRENRARISKISGRAPNSCEFGYFVNFRKSLPEVLLSASLMWENVRAIIGVWRTSYLVSHLSFPPDNSHACTFCESA